MRTVTIKNILNAVNPITVPVVSVENEITGCNDELHLVSIRGNAVIAFTADSEEEVLSWIQEYGARLPMADCFTFINSEDEDLLLKDGSVSEITMSEILEMTNQETPEGYDNELFYDWNVVIDHDKDPSPVLLAAMFNGANVWTDVVQHDACDERNHETDAACAKLDGTTYTFLADGDEYESWEDGKARDQLVDKIDDVEDDLLKTLMNRNIDDLVSDYKNMPEFDTPYTATWSYRGIGYNVLTD